MVKLGIIFPEKSTGQYPRSNCVLIKRLVKLILKSPVKPLVKPLVDQPLVGSLSLVKPLVK